MGTIAKTEELLKSMGGTHIVVMRGFVTVEFAEEWKAKDIAKVLGENAEIIDSPSGDGSHIVNWSNL